MLGSTVKAVAVAASVVGSRGCLAVEETAVPMATVLLGAMAPAARNMHRLINEGIRRLI